MASGIISTLADTAKKLTGVKPGLQTTEFITTVVFGISGLLVSLGIVHTGIPSADRPEVQSFTAIAVALAVGAYSVARAVTKHGTHVSVPDLISQLHTDVAAGSPLALQTLSTLLPGFEKDLGLSATEQTKLKQVLNEVHLHLSALEHDVEDLVHHNAETAPAPTPAPTPSPAGDGTATESGPTGVWPAAPSATMTAGSTSVVTDPLPPAPAVPVTPPVALTS